MVPLTISICLYANRKPYKATQCEHLKDVAAFFAACIAELDSGEAELKVAGWMTGIVAYDNFDEWYSGANADYFFAEIFDYVSELEVPGGPDYYRQAKWGMVRALVRMLEEKHSKKS